MKKGLEYTGVVKEVAFPNCGIVEVEGEEEKAFVKNVIPGQRIRFVVAKKRKKVEGRLLSVEEKSSLEKNPRPCPHFGTCGGCLYQTIPYELQLSLKEEQIRALFSGLFDFDSVYRGIYGSPVYEGYRNKMELSFGDLEKDGELMLGMHGRGSFYDVLDTTDCFLMDEDMRRIACSTLSFFREKGASYYHRRTHRGYLRHLLLRKAFFTGQILVCLVTSSDTPSMYRDGFSRIEEDELLEGWKEALLGLGIEGSFAGILHTKNDRQADIVEDQGTDVLYGKNYFFEELLGLRFEVTPFSFFQTNSAGAEVLYRIVREAIGRDGEGLYSKVFDLYCGTGTISQIVSPEAESVVGVEIVTEAVEAARKNARINGIENCDFISKDVLLALDELDSPPDFIILDPPRDGVHPKALPKILSYGVESIVYISCKSTSLARDLPLFFSAGYEVKDFWIVDLFPSTGNVETVCLLGRRKPDTKVRIDVDLEDYYRIKDSKKNQN